MMEEIILPFGEHKGKPPREVPSDYLRWMLRIKLSTGVRHAICETLRARGLPAPPSPPVTPPGPCPRCGGHEFLAFWHELANGERRIRAECTFCRHFLKFLPHLLEFVHLADENEQPAGLLDLLSECEKRGVRLVSDGKRADFAPGDWQKATPEMRTRVKCYSHRLAGLIGRGTT